MKNKILLLLLVFGINLQANSLQIVSAAGYKKPMIEVIAAFEQKHNIKVEAMYGNMVQVTTQANHGNAELIIGDRGYLEQKSGLKIHDFIFLGHGRVVAAYPKGTILKSIEDLKDEKIQKIAMPQPKRAIYGTATEEFLHSLNLYDALKQKLFIVATVPQVATYVITNEVDAGIINLTAALDNIDKIGGYIEVDHNYYTPIEITAASLKPCNTGACLNFKNFLTSPQSKEIFKKYGL